MFPHTRFAVVTGVGLALGGLLLAGCATLSERECRDQDWYGIGADDGFDGAPASTIEDHRKACTEYGIEPAEASG